MCASAPATATAAAAVAAVAVCVLVRTARVGASTGSVRTYACVCWLPKSGAGYRVRTAAADRAVNSVLGVTPGAPPYPRRGRRRPPGAALSWLWRWRRRADGHRLHRGPYRFPRRRRCHACGVCTFYAAPPRPPPSPPLRSALAVYMHTQHAHPPT